MKREAFAFAFVVLLAGAGMFVLLGADRLFSRGGHTSAPEVHGRRGLDDRPHVRTLRVRVPDVALPPEGAPYVGPDGVDEDGYPRHTADGEALRALLHAGAYTRVTDAFTAYLAEYRANPKAEYVVLDAIDALSPRELAIEHELDAWASASPESYAPYAVRGAFRVGIATAFRGDDFVRDTSARELAAMHREVARAWEDLDRAARLSADAAPVFDAALDAARITSDDARARDARTRAARDCPSCVAWRVVVLTGLEPKWGGSEDAMRAVEREALSHVAQNARLAKLEGRSAYLVAAFRAADRPIAEQRSLWNRHFGDSTYWGHLLLRAWMLERGRDYETELADARTILEQRPGLPRARSMELAALWGLRRWEDAGEAARHVARLEPDNQTLHGFIARAVYRYPHLAGERLAAGDVPGARR